MRPSLSNVLLELPRTARHLYRYFLHKPKTYPNNNIPVIVFPGFLAGDWSTALLRRYLIHKGFNAYGWHQGTNDGVSMERFKHLNEHINTLHEKHNHPVVLIGWSLGGVYAREMSRYNTKIHKVVTLASPFANLFANHIVDLYQIINNETPSTFRTMSEVVKQPINVPSLNLYTKHDGVVHWMSCFHAADDNAISKEVKASHTGIGFEPDALEHIVEFINS